MDSKIGSGIRAFFGISAATPMTRKSGDRDADGRSPYEQRQDSRKKRQPTREEAEKAMQVLKGLDSVSKNGLTLELLPCDTGFEISVRDASGKTVKALRGEDILRLTEREGETADSGNAAPKRGHILDRTL